jgi:hypothetical protein
MTAIDRLKAPALDKRNQGLHVRGASSTPKTMEHSMAKGDLPKYRIKVKDAEGKSATVASIWPTSKKEIFSVRLNMDGHELSGIMVPVSRPADKKAVTPEQKPEVQ